jgi:hypothetical protein
MRKLFKSIYPDDDAIRLIALTKQAAADALPKGLEKRKLQKEQRGGWKAIEIAYLMRRAVEPLMTLFVPGQVTRASPIVVGSAEGLPPLPDVSFYLYVASLSAHPTARRLFDSLKD